MSSSAMTIANSAFSDGFARFRSQVGFLSPRVFLHSPARPTGGDSGLRLGLQQLSGPDQNATA
jgi:hypothetical protein